MHTPPHPSTPLPDLRPAVPPWLATALALQHAGPTAARPLLAGRRFGLICADDRAPEARLFRQAAERLGAHVAHVVPPPAAAGEGEGEGGGGALRRTALLLGRLYDALECQGMPAGTAQRLARDAGIPVFDGAAGATHPSAALADRLDAGLPLAERRCCVLQAVLLHALA